MRDAGKGRRMDVNEMNETLEVGQIDKTGSANDFFSLA